MKSDDRLTKPVIIYQSWPIAGESKWWMNKKNRIWYLINERNFKFLLPINWLMEFITDIKYKWAYKDEI